MKWVIKGEYTYVELDFKLYSMVVFFKVLPIGLDGFVFHSKADDKCEICIENNLNPSLTIKVIKK